MKTIIFIFASILLTTSLLGQTTEVKPHSFIYKGNSTILSNNPDFNLNKFIFGWHWCAGKTMTRALNFNLVHIGIDDRWRIPQYNSASILQNIADSSYMVMNSSIVGRHGSAYSPIFSMSYQYEPTLWINPNDSLAFNKRPYDTTNPVFGFSTIHGYNPPQYNENYNRLVILDSLNNSIILNNIWPNNFLITYVDTLSKGVIKNVLWDNIFNLPKGTPLSRKDTIYAAEYDGVEFYISINLRRLNASDVALNNDKLLAIVLPFENLPVSGSTISGNIKLDSLPDTIYTSTINLPNNRGVARKLIPGLLDTFYITRNMIPKGNEPDRDITLSAHFSLNNKLPDGNYALRNFPGGSPDVTINKIKIVVMKLAASSSLAIDWIRIETRSARDLFRSYWDTTLVKKLQSDLDTIMNPAGPWAAKGLKPYRWYMTDEPGLCYSFRWGVQRYMNKLFGHVVTNEVGNQIPQFSYYLEIPEKWSSLRVVHSPSCIPFVLQPSQNETIRTIENYKRFGYDFGYDLCYSGEPANIRFNLMANSHYETNFISGTFNIKTDTNPNASVTLSDFNSFEHYKVVPSEYGACGHGLFLGQDKLEYENYYEPYQNKYLFDTIPWWGQINLDGRLVLDNSPNRRSYAKGGSLRLMTGEEIRNCMNSLLSFGGKGLMFDGEDTYLDAYDGTVRLHSGQDLVVSLGFVNDAPDIFINREEIGGDFLQQNNLNDPMRNYITIDTVAKYLMIDKNRLFFGRKSMRKEIKKITDFVRHNESLFLNLKLVAGMSKGFRKYYIQDPSLPPDTIMKKYFDFNASILTRPVGRTKTSNNQKVPYYENEAISSFYHNKIDSAFYSVSLMKDKRSPNMDSLFYVYIVNRRTGSHIVLDSADCGKKDSIQFFATAELEDSIQANPVKWSKYYFKRTGSREITLPFNFRDTLNPDQYRLLKITEIKSEDTVLSSDPWWKKDRFKRYVDTIIGMNNDLSILFQAGEGKLLKVEVIKPDVTQQGSLDFSNQCKMVSSPVYNAGGTETGETMYHLTYCKKDQFNKYRVYYVGSDPIKKDAANKENIVWRMPLDLSERIKYLGRTINMPGLVTNCTYPSLVARKDGNDLKVYIVFGVAYSDTATCFSFPCQINDSCSSRNILRTPIAEAIIKYVGSTYPNPDSILKNIIVPRVTVPSYQTYPNVYACPVVGASGLGNYYAWADSNCGIGVNYKPSGQTLFSNPNKYIKFYSGDHSVALHPSVDSYNETVYNSNSCPLVWQEMYNNAPIQPPGFQGINPFRYRIIYTELYLNPAGVINNRIPVINSFPISNNCVNVSHNTDDNRMPVVQRNWNLNRSGGAFPSSYYDHIFWEEVKNINYPEQTTDIAYQPLKVTHNSYGLDSGKFLYTKYITTIKSDSRPKVQFIQPDIATGDSKLHSDLSEYVEYPNDSTELMNVLSFKYQDGVNNKIYNLAFTYGSFANKFLLINGSPQSLSAPCQYVSEGNLSHLSKNWNYNNNTDNKMWRNRRILESAEVNPNFNKKLIPSAKYFYRSDINDIVTNLFLGFIEPYSRNNKYLINTPQLDNSPVLIKLPYKQVTDSSGFKEFVETKPDSIYTDWFHVQNTATLNYKLVFADTVLSRLYLQKQSNNQLINIPKPSNPLNELCFMIYYLINGGNDNYRLLLIKKDTNLVYEERLILGDFAVEDTIYSKSNNSQTQFIDLSGNEVNKTDKINIIAYPNPTSDLIYFTATLPSNLYVNYLYDEMKINYTFTNSLGKIIAKREGKPGEIISFTTNDLPTGAYFINAIPDVYNSTNYENMHGYKTVIVQH